MSPKAMIPISEIVEAAWNLVREEGATRLTARTLAARMGTSTMPIYSSVGNMEALAKLLRQRVTAVIAEYQARRWATNPMLDAAVGYVRFARDEPALFKFLWASAGQGEHLTLEGLAERSRTAPTGSVPGAAGTEIGSFLSNMSPDQQRGLEFHVWIFVHGIASLVAEGIVELDDEGLVAHLEAAGGAFYLYHSQWKQGGAS